MPSRNAAEWVAKPDLKLGEWVDSRIYSEQEIFEEELSRIWKKAWIPILHESELPEPYDFRTAIIAREPVIVVRGPARTGAWPSTVGRPAASSRRKRRATPNIWFVCSMAGSST